ncbi:MAG: 4-(cytidine 5'-diphospho)-2-C-methyl-D-erythritol kinase [Nitrospirales bacterium]|nr:4-(cytidine 5'-diphospho)-2-C-methyl-D-erythritol kinase [Nitrospirales bacterium]
MKDHTAIVVQAPAKINLVLRVLNQLPNGYHALWSLMQTVELMDEISLSFYPQGSDILLRCPGGTVSTGQDNLIHRAAKLVFEQSKTQGGIEIDLTKRIPIAAGLGGGSSDAAATIYGLNQLLGLEWSTQKMASLGATLGSDVPFFFSAPTALVQGWGQDITAMQSSGNRWVVLVNPGFPIETKIAFQRLAERRNKILPISKHLHYIQENRGWSWENLMPLLENDFETVLFPEYESLGQLKTELLESGAEGALLSGSGPTVFGIFPDELSARQAKEAAERTPGRRAFAVPTA